MNFLSGLGGMASGALKGAKLAKQEKDKQQFGYSTTSPYNNNAPGPAGCYPGYCPPPPANHNQPYPGYYPPPAGYQPTSYQQQQMPYPPATNPHSAGPAFQSPPGTYPPHPTGHGAYGAYPQQQTGYPPAPAPGYPPAPYPPATQGSYPAHLPR